MRDHYLEVLLVTSNNCDIVSKSGNSKCHWELEITDFRISGQVYLKTTTSAAAPPLETEIPSMTDSLSLHTICLQGWSTTHCKLGTGLPFPSLPPFNFGLALVVLQNKREQSRDLTPTITILINRSPRSSTTLKIIVMPHFFSESSNMIITWITSFFIGPFFNFFFRLYYAQ